MSRPIAIAITTIVLALVLIGCTGSGPVVTEVTVPTVGSADFQTKVLKAEQPVIVDFYADWCGPCKMQDPHLSKLSREFADQVQTYKLDIAAAGDIAEQYGIRSIPTLIVFKDGRAMSPNVGYHNESEMRTLYQATADGG